MKHFCIRDKKRYKKEDLNCKGCKIEFCKVREALTSFAERFRF